MRDAIFLGAAALAVGAGLAAGWMSNRSPKSDEPAVAALKPIPASTVIGGSRVGLGGSLNDRKTPTAEAVPVTTYSWQDQEKEDAIRRVQRLTASEADYVCLLLGLISQDEVFDKVNVKGRLTRYVEGLRGPTELGDLDYAFQQLAKNHAAR